MIENTIIEYLTDHVQGVPVYAETPVNPETEYIVVSRTGGGERNMIRQATIAVQTTAPSMYLAAELAETVREVMLDIVELPSVFHCSVNAGPYNFTDTDAHKYRYQTVYTVNY